MSDLLGNRDHHVHHGDCIEHMPEMPPESVDHVVYSPPFPAVYAYSSSHCDIGNSEDRQDSKLHLSFFFRQAARILKPGRVMVVHIMQIPRMKRAGEQGLFDFRGMIIRLAERAGFTYEYDWSVRKNPQALKNGTGVLTPRGFVPIDCLVVGSEVIGSDGKPTTVEGVHFHGVRQMYRVELSDGSFVDCDENHRWAVDFIRGARKTPRMVKTTKELMEHGLRTEGGDVRFCIPKVSAPVEFAPSDSPLPIDPYLLGVLIGDGMLSRRSTVGVCCEQEIVDSLTLPAGHSVRKLPKSENGNNVASFHILGDEWHNNHVVSAVRDLGLAGKRAWEKHVPAQYLFASAEDRLAVVQGLLDTDGSLCHKGKPRFNTTSAALAADLKFLVESLGGVCTVIEKHGNFYIHKGERKQGRNIWYVKVILPPHLKPFRMERKLAKWKPAYKNFYRRIVSITPAGQSACTCITVAAPDGLFLTEHCMVTHNSQAIRGKAWELKFQGLESDRAGCRGAHPDYLIKFRIPGENRVRIKTNEVTRNDWIKWAEHCWDDIIETDTLNVAEGRGDDDCKHICPLQLEVIRRLILLYTNPGEIVFSPFTGIGSEGFMALGGISPKTKKCIANPRRFYGCELKDEYYETALRNLARAQEQHKRAQQKPLFGDSETVEVIAPETPVSIPQVAGA